MIVASKIRRVVNITDVVATICWLHIQNSDGCVIWLVGHYNSIFKSPDGCSLSTFRIVNLGQKNDRNENWRGSRARISYRGDSSTKVTFFDKQQHFSPQQTTGSYGKGFSTQGAL